MIRKAWIDPNKKFWAIEAGGREVSYFCHANSSQELQERLEANFMTVQRIEDYDFTDWKERAQRAKERAIDAYNTGRRPIKFNEALWAELKWHLFDLFYGKCAYCESKPQAVSTGDVEHYRPKAKVIGDPGHPGYYWLAYDTTNLLPACESCNRNFGKMNQFPVSGNRAGDEQNIANEDPLLLSPYHPTLNPLEHLEFTEIGKAVAKNASAYGRASIECYRLNRPDLGEPRRNAIQEVRQDWSYFIVRLAGSGPQRVRRVLFEEITIGRRAYSAAQLCELERITQKGGL